MASVYDEDRNQFVTANAIANVASAAAAPTQAEFNAAVAALNSLLAACRDKGILALD